MRCKGTRYVNEIVANGGFNGSYATITTKDGLKLENVPVLFSRVRQSVLLV
jgi:hypothetical protein